MLAGFFESRDSEELAREQISFFIRQAQNGMMEMGRLLQQVADAGHQDIALQCSRLLQVNAMVGNALECAQRCLV